MLIEQYPKIIEAAQDLFGRGLIDSKVKDIEKSYSIYEAAWERNVKRIES